MITAFARASVAPAARPIHRPTVSDTPVWCRAAPSTRTISTATTSLRRRSVRRSANATTRIAKSVSWGPVSAPSVGTSFGSGGALETLGLRLAHHATRRERKRLETLGRDRLLALHARAV